MLIRKPVFIRQPFPHTCKGISKFIKNDNRKQGTWSEKLASANLVALIKLFSDAFKLDCQAWGPGYGIEICKAHIGFMEQVGFQ